MRYIKTVVAIYIISFIFFLILLFPLQNFLNYQIEKIIKKYDIPLTYNSLNINLLSIKIKNPKFDINGKQIELKDININYTPLILINKKLKVLCGKSELFIKLKSNKINFNGKIFKSSVITKALPLCNFIISGFYNYKLNHGKVDVTNNDTCVFDLALGRFSFNKTKLHLNIEKNNINVTLNAKGTNTNLTLKGKVNLNYSNILYSKLALTGNANIGSLKYNFKIYGNFQKPKLSY